MKIKYVHASEPEVEKVYNTEISLKNNSFIEMTQTYFDEMELKSFERDKKKGRVLSYEIIE